MTGQVAQPMMALVVLHTMDQEGRVTQGLEEQNTQLQVVQPTMVREDPDILALVGMHMMVQAGLLMMDPEALVILGQVGSVILGQVAQEKIALAFAGKKYTNT